MAKLIHFGQIPLWFYHFICLALMLRFIDGNLPKEMTIGEGESLFLFWRPTESSLSACSVSTPTENIDLFQSSDSNVIKSPIMTFQEGYCCVKVKVIESKDNGTWQLSAKAGENSFRTETTLTVVSPVAVVNQSFSIKNDRPFTVKCGSPMAIYCRMKSPKGTLWTYLGPCEHTIYDISSFKDEGVWACTFAMANYAREFKAVTEITVIEDVVQELFLHEFTNEYAFYCMTPRNLSYAKLCRITTPYGMNLYLTPGKAYGRYTYYGSRPNHCGVTIPKPLKPQDVGPWKCQLIETTNPSSVKSYGGYMTIGNEKALRNIEVPSNKLFWTPRTSATYLLCHVPYIIKYCWFKSPNGTIYDVKDGNKLSSTTIQTQGFKFGDCAKSFEFSEAKNATGKWTCNIGLAKESVSEISETVSIIYSDIPMIAIQKEVSDELGSIVNLGCQTGEGIGINYCRLIRPDGIGLSVDPTKNNSDYSYIGRGFKYGECGITIHNLKSHDIGIWQCTATLVQDYTNTEYSTKIEIKEEKGSLIAVYIVVGVGSLFALLGLSYFAMKKFEININCRNNEYNTSLIECDSNGEDQNQEDEQPSRSRLQRVNDIVKFVRRRSPRPPSSPESSAYI